MFILNIYLVILEKTIRIPRSLSVKAAGVLKGFLNKVTKNCVFVCVAYRVLMSMVIPTIE